MRYALLLVAIALPLAAAVRYESPLRIRTQSASPGPVRSGAALAVAGDASDGASWTSDVPRRLDLVAREYGYAGPSRVAAGRRVISLRNEGRELHHVQLVKLAAGKQVTDIIAALNATPHITSLPSWAIPMGGPSAALPGATIESESDLTPGRYVVLCWIPTASGTPHFMQGMMMPFDAVEVGREPGPTTGVRTTVMLRDFSFKFYPPTRPGRHTIRVENIGSQAHEFLVVRLQPGARVEEVAEWSAKGQGGEAPVERWVGVAALAPSKSAQLTVDFEPGRYAVFCLSPDRGDGRPHLEHGMHRTFEIAGP